LDGVLPSQFSVKIDLSNAVPGKQSFLITEATVRLPKNIRLLDVSPPSVDLTLAEIVKREITIQPQLVGRLPDNLAVSAITVKPEKLHALLPAIQPKGQGPIFRKKFDSYIQRLNRGMLLGNHSSKFFSI
jgi:hypothetical protein